MKLHLGSECKCFVAKFYEQARSPRDACVNARRKKAEEEREELSEKRSGQSSSRSSFELSPAVEATVPEIELKAELKKVDVATPKIQELEKNDKHIFYFHEHVFLGDRLIEMGFSAEEVFRV
ncbi:unnamed protein product, partial [Strongylus vulgaris]